jgi:hypothetical protein
MKTANAKRVVEMVDGSDGYAQCELAQCSNKKDYCDFHGRHAKRSNEPQDQRERAWRQTERTNYTKAKHRNGAWFAASPGQTCLRDIYDFGVADGSSFEISITQRHWPSASRRQIDIPRECRVIVPPLAAGTVASSLPRI